jgi:hypothetical protein
MYRWRCTGGGGYILLIGFVADRFKSAIHFNLILFSADRFKSAICFILMRFKADMFKSAICFNADMFNYRYVLDR